MKIEFTDEQMAVLNDALVQLPYWRAAPLIQAINEQLAVPQKKEPEGS